MTKDLEKKLQEEFPEFFVDLYGPKDTSCMHWGIETGDGWFHIIHDLCKEIKKIDHEKFKFTQIKEKYGLLRCNVSGSNEKIYKLLEEAVKQSYNVCEICGVEEGVTTEGGWIKTLCPSCRKQ